jgi:hypothetical protein
VKGVFWNSRGLLHLAKTNFLHDLSSDKDLDFIAYSKPTKETSLMLC